MIICIDPGHCKGGVDTGAIGNGLREEDLTLDICKRIKPLLIANGFTVVMTREGDTIPDVLTVNQSLQARCKISDNSKADLFISVHINAFNQVAKGVQTFASGSSASMAFASKMQYYLVQQSGMIDRGLAVANFFVLLQTKAPAVLTENGFIDNDEDAKLLKLPDFRQRIAIAHAKAVCDYFNQPYKENNVTTSSQQKPVPDYAKAAELIKQAIKIMEG